MQLPLVLLLACFTPASAKAADCSAADAQVAQLTAEVDALKKQLAAADGKQCASAPEFSVMGAFSKTSSMAGDVIQHLLQQTELDDQVVSVVSAQAEAARSLTSNIVDQITTHPCASNYDECKKQIAASPIYKTHVAQHMDTLTTAAQPHLESARVYVNPALESAMQAYGSATGTLDIQATVTQSATVASGHASRFGSGIRTLLHSLLNPVFDALSTASPHNRGILPKDPVDRLLFACLLFFIGYNFFFVVRYISFVLVMPVTRLLIKLGFTVPWKLTKMWLSWGFWFGTGFYVCGLCKKRKAAAGKSADAKAEPKKNGATKPATETELVQMLEKAKAKGKLTDGVARLVSAAKSGKALQSPEEMKNKQITKDVLKKALSKFTEVDIKKCGL